MKKKPAVRYSAKELLQRRKIQEDFIRKRAEDFKKNPLEFLRGYCDKKNIWEEGARLVMERLWEIRMSQHLPSKFKNLLKKLERELLGKYWTDIPRHPKYDRDLKKFLRRL